MKIKLLCSATLLACLLSGLSYAQLYKCVGSNGKITFTKHGCSTNSEIEAIRLGSMNTQDNSEVHR